MAYRKLIRHGASRELVNSLLKTESPRREKLLATKVFDQSYPTYEFTVEQGKASRLKAVTIKDKKIILSYPALPHGPASHGNRRAAQTISWRLAELGITGSGPWRAGGHTAAGSTDRHTVFWIAKDLYVDPR